MHPIEEKIAKSFNFVRRDIEQLQKAYLANEKTHVKVLDTIKEQDKQLKQHAVLVDDLKVRLTAREEAAVKRKIEVNKKVQQDAEQISSLKKALSDNQKIVKQAVRDLEKLSKKFEKHVAKKAAKK